MPWKNSWFQLAALVAVISGGLLIYDFAPGIFSSSMAGKSEPPSQTPSTPPIIPPTTPPVSPPTAPPPATSLAPVGPVAGQEWYNSLGMKFVPAGTNSVLFCTCDVRVKDFQAYAEATGYQQSGGMSVMKLKMNIDGTPSFVSDIDLNAGWKNPEFDQGPAHPVVGVSWDEAIAFCEWLTKKERAEGKLGNNQMYRLPTDAEWSTAAGDGKYPWGDAWPPPDDAGNYADQALASNLPGKGWNLLFLPENDGYPRTSPVGSFRANAYGLCDMGGNVGQWCMDWYQASMNGDEVHQKFSNSNNDGGGSKYKVLRGASWDDFAPWSLLSSCRLFESPGNRNSRFGFRLVVVVSP